ncbi:exodeoxyribonuclease VII small subunit [Corynebacterium glyciniphilum]|uniref:exodeoxyribonuclease VII small subunit n=1 Tax=Corynebacterium glyciniphilum TaxID=1404244 RepID=UPI003FD4442F
MSDSDSKQTFRPLEELSYEQARDELVEVVKILELGQMSLDESLRYWERGEELAAYCERYLDGASERVEAALQNRHDADSSENSSDEPEESEQPD